MNKLGVGLLFLLISNFAYSQCNEQQVEKVIKKFYQDNKKSAREAYFERVHADNEIIKSHLDKNCKSCHVASEHTEYINEQLPKMVDFIGSTEDIDLKTAKLTRKERRFVAFALAKLEERMFDPKYRNGIDDIIKNAKTEEEKIAARKKANEIIIAVSHYYKLFPSHTSLGERSIKVRNVLGQRLPTKSEEFESLATDFLIDIGDSEITKEKKLSLENNAKALGALLSIYYPKEHDYLVYEKELREKTRALYKKKFLDLKKENEIFKYTKRKDVIKDAKDAYYEKYPGEKESTGDDLLGGDDGDLLVGGDDESLLGGNDIEVSLAPSFNEYLSEWGKKNFVFKNELTSSEQKDLDARMKIFVENLTFGKNHF